MVTYSPLAVDYVIRSLGVTEDNMSSWATRNDDPSISEKGITGAVERIYQVLVPACVTSVVLSGLLGNILVIYVISSRRHLQTVTNILLMNLAVSDVSFLLICGTFTLKQAQRNGVFMRAFSHNKQIFQPLFL